MGAMRRPRCRSAAFVPSVGSGLDSDDAWRVGSEAVALLFARGNLPAQVVSSSSKFGQTPICQPQKILKSDSY